MKRIDSVNARPNINGTGKTGFHDNADLSGQDATYLTPSWLNQVQEELCNLLEMNGIALNSGVRDQLYQLLATNDDINALAAATQVKLDQEQQWRTNADNNLQQLIWQVDGWRADADAGLQQQINNEQTARINAISQEQTWRENADNSLSVRITAIDNFLNNIVDLFYPVGIIVAFGIPNFNPNDKWAGTIWVRHGEGRASVGVSTQIADPAWTKVVGNTFGAYTHQLTINEMPRHRHSLGDAAGTSGARRTPDLNNRPPESLNDTDSVGYAGGDQPHNNVQPSIVDARWRRVA